MPDLYDRPPVYPCFELADSRGQRITERACRGMAAILFFGLSEAVTPEVLPKLMEAKRLLLSGPEVPVFFIEAQSCAETVLVNLRQYPGITRLSGPAERVKALFRTCAGNDHHGEDLVFVLSPDGRLTSALHAGPPFVDGARIANAARSAMSDRTAKGNI